MKPSGQELKIGLFAAVAMAAAILLVINFSKGESYFESYYRLDLSSPNVGSVISGANVLMAGVPIGSVGTIDLAQDGKSVLIELKIKERYPIYADAQFFIQQKGVLGDEYIAVVPTENSGGGLKDGDQVIGQEPFSLQEAARSASSLIEQVNETVVTVNRVVDRLDRLVLSEGTLGDLAASIENIRKLSDGGVETIENLNEMIVSAQPSFAEGMTNLVSFSERLNLISGELFTLVDANRQELDNAFTHLSGAAGELESLLADVRSGKGLAGSLFSDEGFRSQFSMIVSNFSVLSSNLNQYGLLYKPRLQRNNRDSKVRYPGKRVL